MALGDIQAHVVLEILDTGEEAVLCSGFEYTLELACFW